MDKASRDRLVKVHPELAKRVEATIAALAAKGMDVRVVQGLRTYTEQNVLYSQGRTRKGPKVTNAKGGFSNHNFGLAVDLCPFVDGKADWNNDKAFTAIGAAGKKAGLDWGGDWKSFPDRPHLELPTGMNTKSCRTAYEAGGLPKVWLNASSKMGLPAHVAQLKQSSATVASTSGEPEPRTEGSTSDAQTLTSGNPEAQSPAIVAPVIEVPAMSAAPTQDPPKDEQPSALEKLGNKAVGLWTAFGTMVTGALTWLASNSLPLVVALMASATLLGIAYMFINWRRADAKDKRDREDARLAADREMQLKILREQHVHEYQKFSMESAARDDLSAVTIAQSPPPATELPNSDSIADDKSAGS